MIMVEWTLYLSLITAVLCALVPRQRVSHWLSLSAGFINLALVGHTLWTLTPSAEVITLRNMEWIPFIGARFHLAVDGISLMLIALTAVASISATLFSWNVKQRSHEFFALMHLLLAGVYGVFMSADVLLLFAFYECAIVPKYFLIAIWGSQHRERHAMKLVLYSFIGSALVLLGLLLLVHGSGATSFGFAQLQTLVIPSQLQVWAFPLLTLGFGILAGLWPLHTWAPDGHVSAPTAVSMLLAGVIMKLGAYSVLRVPMALLPYGTEVWRTPFAWLAVIGILYGACVALVQKDFKYVIGYSSVSHMGFVLLGLMSLHFWGLAGAVVQMVSHGILAGLLFAVVGRMIYDRTHTRDLSVLPLAGLRQKSPFVATVFVLAVLASMGMPGFSGFVAEVLVIVGAWNELPGFAIAAVVGVILASAYSMRVVQLVFFSKAENIEKNDSWSPITWSEKLGAGLLLVGTLLIGLMPDVLLRWIIPCLEQPALLRLIEPGGNWWIR